MANQSSPTPQQQQIEVSMRTEDLEARVNKLLGYMEGTTESPVHAYMILHNAAEHLRVAHQIHIKRVEVIPDNPPPPNPNKENML